MANFYKFLILAGLILILAGLILLLFQKLNFPFGKLPGDILIKKENFSFYFPFTSCLIISVFLTLIFILIKNKH